MNPPAFRNDGGFGFLVWNESGFKTGPRAGCYVASNREGYNDTLVLRLVGCADSSAVFYSAKQQCRKYNAKFC